MTAIVLQVQCDQLVGLLMFSILTFYSKETLPNGNFLPNYEQNFDKSKISPKKLPKFFKISPNLFSLFITQAKGFQS